MCVGGFGRLHLDFLCRLAAAGHGCQPLLWHRAAVLDRAACGAVGQLARHRPRLHYPHVHHELQLPAAAQHPHGEV
eukprot:350808-Chlamydomonas_euryale.AAC.4